MISITDNIRNGLGSYIDTIGVYNTHWDEAMYILSQAANLPSSLSRLSSFSNSIVLHSGVDDFDVG